MYSSAKAALLIYISSKMLLSFSNKVLVTESLIGSKAPYCNIYSRVRESDSKVSLTSVGNCLIVQHNRFFVSNGTVTKNSALFFVSSPTEVVTEIEDEVFCTIKFKLAAVIKHS